VANLTLAIDDAVLRRARLRAVGEDTTVNATVRAYLEDYADGAGRRGEAWRNLIELAGRAHASSGPTGRTWTRQDVNDRGRASGQA
jgi:hypothetical protein